MLGLSRRLVDPSPSPSEALAVIDTRASIAAEFALQWQAHGIRHTDCRYLAGVNLWQDLFPQPLLDDLVDQPAGGTLTHGFDPGELVAPFQESLCLELPVSAFRNQFGSRSDLLPRAGRFYPQALLRDVPGVFPEAMTPFRVCEVDDALSVDLNHPLAGCHLSLTTSVLSAWSTPTQGGACKDVAQLVTDGGPGMQVRWQGRATDFRSGVPFARADEAPDAEFYARPRLLNHVDTAAVAVIEALYAQLLPAAGRVLDLMAAWRSHLPDSSDLRVTGLGMNQDELNANPRLEQRCVQDLNARPLLEFADGAFDAVVCTASIEYLTRPAEVIAEVRRVLVPGGRFVVTFSNRWFPPKAIALWSDCHEFERLGLVLDYLLRDGGFEALESWSLRGLPRPAGDRYADRLVHSDPVYAVWGQKTPAC